MSVALALVAVIVLGTFGLVLILAGRLRAVTVRVNMFLPAMEDPLPPPGTAVPEFDAVSVDGQRLGRDSFAGVDRVFALLSTSCGACDAQVAAFRELGASLDPPAIVAVVGPPEDRAPMVSQLDGHVVLIEEPDPGPVASAVLLS